LNELAALFDVKSRDRLAVDERHHLLAESGGQGRRQNCSEQQNAEKAASPKEKPVLWHYNVHFSTARLACVGCAGYSPLWGWMPVPTD
jgi:hypothetical protein